MLKKFIYNFFLFLKNITHGDEVVDKYLIYVVKWVTLEDSHTLYSKQEETRKVDVLFFGYKWMKKLIRKTWIKIDVELHHFDYSSLFCVSLLDFSKVIHLKKYYFLNTKINRYYYVMKLNLF